MDEKYFVFDEEQMAKLRAIQARLHAGTDKERDEGHRLWLLLNQAVEFAASDFKVQ